MRKHLVICGNGAAAAALLVALAKLRCPLHVTVIGSGAPWRGVAYSTASAYHLLNVPSANMSIDQDDPGHFLRWLQARGRGRPDSFEPRGIYGAYLEDSVSQSLSTASGLQLVHISAELLGLTLHAGRWQIFHDHGVIAADAAVLATGVERPTPLSSRYGQGLARHIVEDPWLPWKAKPDEQILIVGTGLTAVDCALSLIHAGHKGDIIMLSRHGLLPLSQDPCLEQRRIDLPHSSLSRRLKYLRQAIRNGLPWQPVFDSLRPHWPGLWRELEDEEKERFLRHAALFFNVHRHRMAPGPAAAIAAARKQNLDVIRGRLIAMTANANGLGVTMRVDGVEITRQFDKVINCIGPNSNLGASGQTFIQTLIGAGLARPHSLGLGIEVDDESRVCGRNGTQPSLFALGALCRGRWWEITAMPEIRQQAADVAQSIWKLYSSEASLAQTGTSIAIQPFTGDEDEYRVSPTGP